MLSLKIMLIALYYHNKFWGLTWEKHARWESIQALQFGGHRVPFQRDFLDGFIVAYLVLDGAHWLLRLFFSYNKKSFYSN